MILSPRNVLISALACASVAAVIVACGNSDGSTFNNGTSGGPGVFPEAGLGDGGTHPDDSLYKNDPLPLWCGPDSGVAQKPIGGTADCPDDKNKPGCGCDHVGDKQACWTGLRKNRGLGTCKDGQTTCLAKTETENQWGDCVGEVLPTIGATGKEACACFSVGEWNIANTAPCLHTPGDGTYQAYSTVLKDGQATGCLLTDPVPPPGVAPTADWSTDTLKVDCAGTYTLKFRIRAGDYNNPNVNDCILGESQIQAVYDPANVVQTLPPLPAWAGKDPACAKKWEFETPLNVSPGYGEMVVLGQTVLCEDVTGSDAGAGSQVEFVFHRVEFCARSCRDPNNANNPECKACQLAGTGEFH